MVGAVRTVALPLVPIDLPGIAFAAGLQVRGAHEVECVLHIVGQRAPNQRWASAVLKTKRVLETRWRVRRS